MEHDATAEASCLYPIRQDILITASLMALDSQKKSPSKPVARFARTRQDRSVSTWEPDAAGWTVVMCRTMS